MISKARNQLIPEILASGVSKFFERINLPPEPLPLLRELRGRPLAPLAVKSFWFLTDRSYLLSLTVIFEIYVEPARLSLRVTLVTK